MAIMKLPAVEAATGLKRSSVYALIQRGEFPKQIKLSARSSGWLSEEIEGWIAAKRAERDAKAA